MFHVFPEEGPQRRDTSVAASKFICYKFREKQIRKVHARPQKSVFFCGRPISHAPRQHRHFSDSDRRFFFVLFSSFRFALNLVILERPLAVGFFWGAVFGDLPTALSTAIFFELFWLDLIPAGTFIPPNHVASTLAALCLMNTLHLSTPSGALVAIAAALPFSRLLAKAEDMQREYENRVFAKSQDSRGRSGALFAPGRLIARSIVDMAVINGLVFTTALAGAVLAMAWLAPILAPIIKVYPLSWAQIWLFGSLGAILSFRYRPAYVVFVAGLFLAVLWYAL